MRKPTRSVLRRKRADLRRFVYQLAAVRVVRALACAATRGGDTHRGRDPRAGSRHDERDLPLGFLLDLRLDRLFELFQRLHYRADDGD